MPVSGFKAIWCIVQSLDDDNVIDVVPVAPAVVHILQATPAVLVVSCVIGP